MNSNFEELFDFQLGLPSIVSAMAVVKRRLSCLPRGQCALPGGSGSRV